MSGPQPTDGHHGANEAITSDTTSVTEKTDGEHFDELFRALANERRRAVVYALDDESELSAQCCAERIGDARSPASHRELHLSLIHVHFPLLADADVIGFDAENGLVTPGPRFTAAISVLEESPSARPGSDGSV
jgi:DNA-binding transcriptional ArsR family regulator